MLWVIIGHQFSQRKMDTNQTMDLKMFQQSYKFDWNLTLIWIGQYSVDFFLFMGGYVAILSLQKIINEFKKSSWWKWPVLYLFLLIKRYVRIFPVMFLSVFFIGYVYYFITAQNPTNDLLTLGGPKGTSLDDYNLPFVDNVRAAYTSTCGYWLWYLAVDYQCFMVVPFILMINHLHKRAGLVVCICFTLFSIIYSFVQLIQEKIYFGTNDHNYYFSWIDRMGIYFIGCSFALCTLTDQKSEPKKDTNFDENSQDKKQTVNIDTQLDYEIKPKVTLNTKKTNFIKKQKGVYILGSISLIIVVSSFVIMNRCLQDGHDTKSFGIYTNAIYKVFGKILFVLSVMMLLIAICKYSENFQKAISNNAITQLIAN